MGENELSRNSFCFVGQNFLFTVKLLGIIFISQLAVLCQKILIVPYIISTQTINKSLYRYFSTGMSLCALTFDF
jgi:hypothetical protein